MEYETEFSAPVYAGPKPAGAVQRRFYFRETFALTAGVIDNVAAQVVWGIGLGYARNVFPEAYGLVSPATYERQEIPPPYGPTGQPVSPDTGAG